MPLSHSKTDTRGAKAKRQSNRPKGGKPQGGKSRGGRPQDGRPRGDGGSGAAGGRGRKEMPYFIGPIAGGGTGVFRRPVGNRAEATNCGVMPSRKMADLLIAQLKRAESVVSDLFLEATDDGIEALEAVLAACRDAVLKQGEARQARHSRPVRADTVTDANGGGGANDDARKPRRGRGRRRGRNPRLGGAENSGNAPSPDAG